MALGFYTYPAGTTAVGTSGNPFTFTALNTAASYIMRCTDYGADDIHFEGSGHFEISYDGSTWYDFASEPAKNVQGVNATVAVRQVSYAASAQVTFLTTGIYDTAITVTTQLTTPTIGTATANSSTAITVTWTDVSNEDSYTIEYVASESDPGSGTWTGSSTTTATANATSKQVTGLTAGSLYWFRVKAEGSGSYTDSAYSSSVSARAAVLSWSDDGKILALNFNTADQTPANSITEESVTWSRSSYGGTSNGTTVGISSNKLRLKTGANQYASNVIYVSSMSDVADAVIQVRSPSNTNHITQWGIWGRFGTSGTADSGVMINVYDDATPHIYVNKYPSSGAGAGIQDITGQTLSANDLYTLSYRGNTTGSARVYKNGTYIGGGDTSGTNMNTTGKVALWAGPYQAASENFDHDNFVVMKCANNASTPVGITVTNLPSGWYFAAYDGTTMVKSGAGSGSGDTLLDCSTLDFTAGNAGGVTVRFYTADPSTTWGHSSAVTALDSTARYSGAAGSF